MDGRADIPDRSRRRRLAVLLWVGFILVAGVFIAYRCWAARQYELAVKAWEQQRPRRAEAAAKLRDDIWTNPDLSQGGLELRFNAGRPFRPGRVLSTGERSFYLDDPATGWSLTLWFKPHEGLSYVGFHAGPPSPRPTAGWMLLEHARQIVAGYGIILWLIILGETLLYSRAARITGQLLLGGVLLAGLAWLCGPDGYLGPDFDLIDRIVGIEARGANYWLVVMALISIGVLIWAFSGSRYPSDEPHCLYCGYDLIGNESGVCPECGHRIHKAILWLIRQHPVGPPRIVAPPPTVEPADLVGMGPAEGESAA